MSSLSGARPFTAFLVVALIAACVFIVLLLRQNRGLRAELEAATKSLVEERTKGQLAIGSQLSAVTLTDSGGRTRTLAFGPEKWTLVFLVGGHCPYCEETVPIWQKLVTESQVASHPAIALATIQLDAKAATDLKPLDAPLAPELALERSGWLAKVPIVPSVLLVDRKGVLRRAWYGLPTTEDQQQLGKTMLGIGLDE